MKNSRYRVREWDQNCTSAAILTYLTFRPVEIICAILIQIGICHLLKEICRYVIYIPVKVIWTCIFILIMKISFFVVLLLTVMKEAFLSNFLILMYSAIVIWIIPPLFDVRVCLPANIVMIQPCELSKDRYLLWVCHLNNGIE